ncbi:right-handed parallel beta-helix repeat-containing protein [Jiangella sp. DSM 45060]|uniref:right-handed parallel beta-helix repeat-containing protein n=1 Tax=Jiangella sp. DSM 45060 TaxID=1798224 RepID=UPI00087A8298|nr:right-handed parallel beta-helix repeat-containing protein [Jiangella sp. DSM 45060]SDT47342.1 Pectate lyase superfamily protein [Jiangella sp. DSM 45060]
MTDRINRRMMIRSAAGAGVVGVGGLALGGTAHAETAPPSLVEADGTPVLTPQQFGALGDGVADDTAAIQAAIDAARSQLNKIVVLPPGQYKVTSTIVVGDHEYETPGEHLNRFVLRGYGMFGEESSKITFHHDGVGIRWEASLGGIHGIAFDAPVKTANNVALHVARNSANTDDTDVTIVECSFLRFQRAIESVGRGFLFTKNKIAVCTTGITISWPAGEIPGGEVHKLPYGLRKWLITDNHFHSNFDAIIFNGAPDGEFRGAVISNNLLDIGRRLFKGSLTNSTISGNVVENGNGNAIIEIGSGGHNLTITGNVIGGFDTTPGAHEPPIYAISFLAGVAATNVTISANTFNWLRGSPIGFAGSADKVSITDNSFDHYNLANTAVHGAVRVQGDATRFAIVGNAFSANRNAAGLPIRVDGTLSASNVVGNVFEQGALVAAGSISADSFVESAPGRFTRLEVAAAKDAAARVHSTATDGIAAGDGYGGYLVESALTEGAGPGVKGGVEVVAVNASGSAATNLLCSTNSTNEVVAFQASVAGLIPPTDNARDIGSPDASIRTVYTYATRLHPYTVATMPSAADAAGALIQVVDGRAGGPCLAMSDGTAWRTVPLGNAVR